jgi:hypothetical protein
MVLLLTKNEDVLARQSYTGCILKIDKWVSN